MECPVCRGKLKKLPNNSQRMKCPSCRKVFDVNQLERLYGFKAGDKVHVSALPFETEHMHETHSSGGAGSGHMNVNDQVSSSVFVDANVPVIANIKNKVGGWEVSASNMISRDEQRMAASERRSSQTKPDSNFDSSFVKTLIKWLVILFFVVPFVFSIIVTIFGLLVFDLPNEFVENHSSFVWEDTSSSLPSYEPAVSAKFVENDNKEYLLVDVSWESAVKRDYGADVFWYKAQDAEGFSISEVNDVDVIGNFFNQSDRFNDIDLGERGSFGVLYDADELPMEFRLYSNEEYFDYDDAPYISCKFDQNDNGDLKIVSILPVGFNGTDSEALESSLMSGHGVNASDVGEYEVMQDPTGSVVVPVPERDPNVDVDGFEREVHPSYGAYPYFGQEELDGANK